MNIFKLLICCAVFGLVSASFADEDKDLTSQDLRKDKTWIATGQVFGLGPIPGTVTQGGSFGYFIAPDLIISAEVVSGNSPLILFENTSYRSLKYNSVGIHAKNFVGRSFYVKGGIDVNRFTEDYVGFTTTNFHGFDSDSTSASIVIGNQWQFSHFTLGCDWVGMTLPLTSNIKSEYASDNFEKASLEDDKTRYLKSSGLQLLRFYLGASW